ncbi:ABC transporter permease [Candidatus Bipolaricaulota bacterium]|nr:ABC transporter permease [Candidatus Bipolaricaulota bacterium]
MKDILHIARAHITTALRERITLFWFVVFPVFLLTILSLIFGKVGNEGEISFEISLINQEDSASSGFAFSDVIAGAFHEMSTTVDGALEPLFSLHTLDDATDSDQFLESELTALRRGRRAAVLLIPAGLNQAVVANLLQPDASTALADPVRLQLFMSDSNAASTYASQIIQQVLTEIDRRILVEMGRFDDNQAIASETHWIGGEGEETSYVDFVLPGIILMGFFVNGLFGVPGTILFNRDRKVLRRYWVTPLSVARYLVGFGLGHLTLCAVQFVLLYSLGVFVFGAAIRFASPASIGLLILAATTFMAFGFLIASLAKTANGGMATANILNMPMMFLSGLFFPTSGLPVFMMVIVYLNPVSYLLEGLRHSVGVQNSTLMPALTILLVPIGWILLSSLVTSRRLKWDVER